MYAPGLDGGRVTASTTAYLLRGVSYGLCLTGPWQAYEISIKM